MPKIAKIFLIVLLPLLFFLEMKGQAPLVDTELTTPEYFSPAQDSAFKEAGKLNIPPEIRFLYDLELNNESFRAGQRSDKSNEWMKALQDLQKRYPNLFMPTEVEAVQYQISQQQSMYVPYLNTMNNAGLQIPLEAIAKFMGLTEDVSPVIKYELEYPSEVEVVIYNMSGIVIATLLEERQPAGKYTFVWDFKSDEGAEVPRGDYIGEVRIGKEKLIRKRIVKK